MTIQTLAVLGVLVAAPIATQSADRGQQETVNLRITNATVAEVVEAIARQGRMTVRFDSLVPPDIQTRPMEPSRLSFVDVPVLAALELVARHNGLTLAVESQTTVVLKPKRVVSPETFSCCGAGTQRDDPTDHSDRGGRAARTLWEGVTAKSVFPTV